jgi:hypothetical protein
MPRLWWMTFGALISLGSLTAIHPARAAAEFRAATSKTDITPDDLVVMWGYADRSGPATGTLDPLYAKILLLDDGRIRLA